MRMERAERRTEVVEDFNGPLSSPCLWTTSSMAGTSKRKVRVVFNDTPEGSELHE